MNSSHPDSETSPHLEADVVVVGAGFAGCLAAILLGRANHKVIILDPMPLKPDLFRAEKISGDQISMLSDIGLLDDFKAHSTPVTEFINIRGRYIVDRVPTEEYGLKYASMIELLRRHMPATVSFKRARVTDIETSSDDQKIRLADGEDIKARLVVIATGYGATLHRSLGFERRPMHPAHTLCIGFSLNSPPEGFSFPALAAYGERTGDNVDYLSLFPLGTTMRGNLFMFTDIKDPKVSALRDRGLPALLEILPGLRPWLHSSEWMGDVSIFPVELYKNQNVDRDGVVLVGDAYKTCCPAVGTGLSCALVDAIRLSENVTAWLKTPGMDASKIVRFYNDVQKSAFDLRTDRQASDRRHEIMCTTLPHKLRRNAHFIKRSLLYRTTKHRQSAAAS